MIIACVISPPPIQDVYASLSEYFYCFSFVYLACHISTDASPAQETLEVVETAVVPPFKENTVEAVKAFHEKPLASKNVQIKNPQVVNNMHIQQPRK